MQYFADIDLPINYEIPEEYKLDSQGDHFKNQYNLKSYINNLFFGCLRLGDKFVYISSSSLYIFII